MSYASVVALLQAALMLLSLAQGNPALPQSVRDNAIQVAQQAISQATTALGTQPVNQTNPSVVSPTASLAVTCTGTVYNTSVNGITWSAQASGGTGNYTYKWNLSDDVSFINPSLGGLASYSAMVQYTSAGIKHAYVTVSDGTSNTVASCNATVSGGVTPQSAASMTLTSPTANMTYTVGSLIPISWSYTNAPSNAQVTLSLAALSTIPGIGNVGGGSWQSTVIGTGSGTGSYTWQTGSGGYLDVPGTYQLTAAIRACDSRGCNYSGNSTATTYATANPVTITVASTKPALTILSSTSGQISASYYNMPRAGVRVIRDDTGLSAWTQQLNGDGSQNGSVYISITNGIGSGSYHLEAYGTDGTIYAKSPSFNMQSNIAPIWCNVTSSNAVVRLGQTFTLTWSSSNATSMTGLPTQNQWAANGSQAAAVFTDGPVTYNLVFHDQYGNTATCSTTVFVSDTVTVTPGVMYRGDNQPFTISGTYSGSSGTLYLVLYPGSNVSNPTWQSVQSYALNAATSASVVVQGGTWTATFPTGYGEGTAYTVLIFDSAPGNALIGQIPVTFTDKG